MRRFCWTTLLTLALVIGAVTAGRSQTLSEQVLLLLARINTWTATQTFTNVVITGTCTGCGGAGGGTVTSVALTAPAAVFDVAGSPIVGAGTLAITFDTQAANTSFSGPVTGAAAAPTFRALVDADVPDDITINGTNNVTWASVNKTGSSLANLATRAITDLTGTLALANLTDGGTAGIPLVAGGGGGDPNYAAVDVSGAAITGVLKAASFPALTGDITTAGGALATTLANTGVGAATYGSATQVPQVTLDAKGRATAASNTAIALNASAITAGTLGLARGGTAADLSATGGANQFVRQNGAGAVFTVSAIADADVPDTITINGTNNVTWASVNKTGSSLADLVTRSAADLTSGALADARLSANVPLLNAASNTFTGYLVAASMRPTTYVSVGSTLPTAGAVRLEKGATIYVYGESVADFHGQVYGSFALTDAGNNDLFEIALPQDTWIGAKILFTIVADDGTDYQARSGMVTLAAVDKATALTSSILEGTAAAGLEADAVSAGTLTDVWSIVDGADKITVRLVPTSSLTPTTMRVYYTVVLNGPHAITVL